MVSAASPVPVRTSHGMRGSQEAAMWTIEGDLGYCARFFEALEGNLLLFGCVHHPVLTRRQSSGACWQVDWRLSNGAMV